MTEQDKDPLLLDHEADGIQELDNFLPRWWLWLFWINVVIFVVYMAYYHLFHLGATSAEAYQREMTQARAQLEAAAPAPPPPGEGTAATPAPSTSEQPAEPSLDEATLARGKEIFTQNCVACHGPQGQGLVGPNFTDNYFLHGPTFADSVRTATEGVPAKGMIPWGPILGPEKIHDVCSYIWTLRGTNPPNPKPAQGEEYHGPLFPFQPAT